MPDSLGMKQASPQEHAGAHLVMPSRGSALETPLVLYRDFISQRVSKIVTRIAYILLRMSVEIAAEIAVI